MYKIENGEIVKSIEQPVGGLPEVVQELNRLSGLISSITATYNRAFTEYEKVPELQAQLESLIEEAKKLPVNDDLDENSIAKLQEYNIL